MDSKEKCGVFGVYGKEDDAARLVYYGLWSLQHRGQENSGIACSNGKKILAHKGKGLVAHVYEEEDLKKLKGHIAIGHNRYSTFGKSDIDHSQPVYHNQNVLALAHNGNLPVVKELQNFLQGQGIATEDLNDSEMMHQALRYWMVKGLALPEAVRVCYPLFTGAFSLLLMSKNELVAVRDRYGIRPLSIGKINGSVHVFSSETCALNTIGAEYIRDVEPGEMVVVNKDGLHSYKLFEGKLKLDVFELIYFSRPDSMLLGKSVYNIRKNLGVQLAAETNLKIDMVIPVPDSSIPSAIGFSQATGIPYEEALTKNRYIHRTFIKPSQKQRNSGVNMKLHVNVEVVRGKKVALVDDSIVRGTTSKKLADSVRNAGAKEVHMLVSSPPVLYPDFYGIDTPKQSELAAATMNSEELREYIGVDSLNYLSYDGLIKAIGVSDDQLCCSCLTGEYPISIGSNAKKIKKIMNFYPKFAKQTVESFASQEA